MTSECFLLRQRICVSDEVMSRNFAKIMLCLRDMANLAGIFEKP